MNGVQCYELFVGIAFKSMLFLMTDEKCAASDARISGDRLTLLANLGSWFRDDTVLSKRKSFPNLRKQFH